MLREVSTVLNETNLKMVIRSVLDPVSLILGRTEWPGLTAFIAPRTTCRLVVLLNVFQMIVPLAAGWEWRLLFLFFYLWYFLDIIIIIFIHFSIFSTQVSWLDSACSLILYKLDHRKLVLQSRTLMAANICGRQQLGLPLMNQWWSRISWKNCQLSPSVTQGLWLSHTTSAQPTWRRLVSCYCQMWFVN